MIEYYCGLIIDISIVCRLDTETFSACCNIMMEHLGIARMVSSTTRLKPRVTI